MQDGPTNPEYVYVHVTVTEHRLVRVRADSDAAKEERRQYGGPGGWARKQVHAADIGEGRNISIDVLGEDGGYWLAPMRHRADEFLPGGIVFIESPNEATMSEENLDVILELFKAEGVDVRSTWNNDSAQVSVKVAKMPDRATLGKLTAQMAHLEPLRAWDSTGSYGHTSHHEDPRGNFTDAEVIG
jgi:hypothetical protein